MTDSLPAQISPRYKVMQLLGEGGMGRVYKIHDVTLNREVAIKVLIGQYTNQDLPRFQREAKAMSRLKHPNLIDVYDFGITDEGSAYLVMELAPGKMLSEILRQRGHLSVDETIKVSLAIADGVFHAHNKKVVHRDLKPSNILVLDDQDLSQIKVFDFGISKTLDESDKGSLTRPGAMIGTPLYMSPEQARGDSVDQRSDLYSLGCIMYACLSGKPPFKGDTALDTIKMHIEEQPKSLSSNQSLSVPNSIDSIVMKLLEKKPQDRYQSMAQLTEALVHASTEPSIKKNPNVVHIRKQQSAKETLSVLSLVALGLVLLFPASGIYNASQPFFLPKKQIDAFHPKTNNSEYGDTYGNLQKIESGAYSDRNLTKAEFDHALSIWLEPSAFAKLPKNSVRSMVIHNYSRFTDGAFEQLASFPKILELIIYNESITGDKIATLNRMKTLERLKLTCANFGDTDLHNLSGLPRLKLLHLQKSGVGDNGMQWLVKNFPNLEILDLGRTLLQGKTLGQLSRLNNLKSLSIDHMDLTDESILKIRGFKNLKAICIVGNPQLTEKSLISLFLTNPKLERAEITACPNLLKPGVKERLAKACKGRGPVELVSGKEKYSSGIAEYQDTSKKLEGFDELSGMLGN